ncbi:hypothetical protein PV11_03700 [Exophiala sideris]|uniref:Uncharacterized protein n=1 Tax=Exophiala sideris TaxID=1016849 RepID=A0A0D1YF53_9EURO|nr:hypothetical protein PV11_03700 [Exophiala sideris]
MSSQETRARLRRRLGEIDRKPRKAPPRPTSTNDGRTAAPTDAGPFMEDPPYTKMNASAADDVAQAAFSNMVWDVCTKVNRYLYTGCRCLYNHTAVLLTLSQHARATPLANAFYMALAQKLPGPLSWLLSSLGCSWYTWVTSLVTAYLVWFRWIHTYLMPKDVVDLLCSVSVLSMLVTCPTSGPSSFRPLSETSPLGLLHPLDVHPGWAATYQPFDAPSVPRAVTFEGMQHYLEECSSTFTQFGLGVPEQHETIILDIEVAERSIPVLYADALALAIQLGVGVERFTVAEFSAELLSRATSPDSGQRPQSSGATRIDNVPVPPHQHLEMMVVHIRRLTEQCADSIRLLDTLVRGMQRLDTARASHVAEQSRLLEKLYRSPLLSVRFVRLLVVHDSYDKAAQRDKIRTLNTKVRHSYDTVRAFLGHARSQLLQLQSTLIAIGKIIDSQPGMYVQPKEQLAHLRLRVHDLASFLRLLDDERHMESQRLRYLWWSFSRGPSLSNETIAAPQVTFERSTAALRLPQSHLL